ncbi:MAG: PQQ-binding-like beta-propeller repeat protein [Dehalococcoidia bacterium]|nr:PQQ-binding-like beta-propeller repeat protein [Dehalococcoidia bacterium]
MKQVKILALIVIALFALLLVSCIPGTGQPTGGWSGAAVRDGIIYVGSRDGRVVAINSSTRSQQWDYTITPATGIYTTPIVDGDLVYVGTYNGIVLALNTSARVEDLPFPQARYGEWEWYCPIENAKSNAIVADLAMSEDALYVASSNGRVYSLDKGSGDENWKREDIPVLTENAEKLWNSPVIQGNTLYVSTFDGHIYTLSAETGQLLDWSFEAEAGFASAPVIYEDIIYVGSFDRHLYAATIGSDVPLWKFPQEKPAGNWFWASPIINEGIVYAGCLDGKLYAIEAKTGEELWEFDAESPIVSSPVLIDNLLIVGAESGNVYVINPETGVGERIKNRENSDKPTINDQIRASLCAHEGLVYVRGEDNQLYIVDIGNKEVSQPIPLTVEE